MTTIYSRIQNNFTQISNEALLDVRLSGKAYKLYAYMCYRIGTSSKWEFNEKEIIKNFKEGRESIRSAFKELIEYGWLIKTQKRVAGKFSKNDYEIFSSLVNTESIPLPKKPLTAEPSTENPMTENHPYNNKELINKDLNNKESISLKKEKEIFEKLNKNWKKYIVLEEVKAHFDKKGYKSNAEKFFNRYSARGWKGIENWLYESANWELNFKEMNNEPKTEIKTSENLKPVEKKEKVKLDNKNPKWKEIIKKLKSNFGKEIYDKWICKAGFISENEKEIYLGAPTKFLRDWIKREYLKDIKEVLNKEVIVVYMENFDE